MKKWIWHSDVWSFLCYNLTFTERKLGQICCQIFIYSLIFYIYLFFLSSPLSVFISPHFSIYYMCIYNILFFFTIFLNILSLSPTFVHILILSHLSIHMYFFSLTLSLSLYLSIYLSLFPSLSIILKILYAPIMLYSFHHILFDSISRSLSHLQSFFFLPSFLSSLAISNCDISLSPSSPLTSLV